MRTRGAKIRSRARAFAPACAIILYPRPNPRGSGRWRSVGDVHVELSCARVGEGVYGVAVSSFKEFSQYDAIGLAELLSAAR